MIQPEKSGKGPAIVGALFLSGCTDQAALRDTVFLATRPVELFTWYLGVVVLLLGAWWLIARLAPRPPRRRPLFLAGGLLTLGLLMASAPTVMLVTGLIWPSVFIVFQIGAIGVGVVGFVVAATALVLIWHAVARLLDRP